MYKSFLIKYAEIGVKGKNRYIFEDRLCDQIRYALTRCEGEFEVTKTQGRIYVNALTDFDFDETVDNLKTVFGISAICPVVHVEDEGFEKLCEDVVAYMDSVYPDKNITFKVEARRARKNYPKCSMVVIPGPGGMPIGTNGKGMLLLSGGIDSPVAGYMISKRGVKIDAVYFHAPPYTSERAKQKVVDLAKLVSRYSGPINLHVINFTDIQLYIYEKYLRKSTHTRLLFCHLKTAVRSLLQSIR